MLSFFELFRAISKTRNRNKTTLHADSRIQGRFIILVVEIAKL